MCTMRRCRWLLAAALMILLVADSDGVAAEDLGVEIERYEVYDDLVAEAPSSYPRMAERSGAEGPAVRLDDTETRVWLVRNQWEDTDTREARMSGIPCSNCPGGYAWESNSGLTWEGKFSRWIDSLQPIPSFSGSYETFELTTPWGTALQAPVLDCADVAIFLRVSFAAWYGLPLFLEAWDSRAGEGVYFGHFGIRTQGGEIWRGSPRFRSAHPDHSNWSEQQIARREWPRDHGLRQQRVGFRDETWGRHRFLEDAPLGEYLDRIHLNKRVGYLILHMLTGFGSSNLASSKNSFHVKPRALGAGDFLLRRRSHLGTGHLFLITRRHFMPEGHANVEIVYGDLPPSQPHWARGGAARFHFLSPKAGGAAESSEGVAYASLGGGLKRFRLAKQAHGHWHNTWSEAAREDVLESSDFEGIGQRIDQFREMLEIPLGEEIASLKGVIDRARDGLRYKPSSCASRETREDAFRELYRLYERHFGLDRQFVDGLYRLREDYIFPELSYTRSRTCCWNGTSAGMYALILEKVDADLRAAAGHCAALTTFKAVDRGYDDFASFAADEGAAWSEWRNDENCSWASDIVDDREMEHEWTPYCALATDKSWRGDRS